MLLFDGSDSKRFWSKVTPAEPDECWLWTAEKGTCGYGVFRHAGKRLSAHRLAYQDRIGPIPEGTIVRHTCENKACVNPGHLQIGTFADNMRELWAAGRLGQSRSARGAAQGLAKLRDEQVLELRKLYAEGTHTRVALGMLFGISYSTVRQILRRETWTHI